jgi:hypothetical protein
MTVYVVICNGNLDEIFADRDSAEHHAAMLLKKWNIVRVFEKIVHSI